MGFWLPKCSTVALMTGIAEEREQWRSSALVVPRVNAKGLSVFSLGYDIELVSFEYTKSYDDHD